MVPEPSFEGTRIRRSQTGSTRPVSFQAALPASDLEAEGAYRSRSLSFGCCASLLRRSGTVVAEIGDRL